VAKQKRIFREWQHPRDGQGRFAKTSSGRVSKEWVDKAEKAFKASPGLEAQPSAPGRPRISRAAKGEAIFSGLRQGGRPSPVRAPKAATITPAPAAKGLAGFNAPDRPGFAPGVLRRDSNEALASIAAIADEKPKMLPKRKTSVDTSRVKSQDGGMSTTNAPKPDTAQLGTDTAGLKRPGARKGDLVVVERRVTNSYGGGGTFRTEEKTEVILGIVTSTDRNGKITSYSTDADGRFPRKVDNVREKTLKLEAERVDVAAAIEAGKRNPWSHDASKTGMPFGSVDEVKAVVAPFLGDQREKLKAARAAGLKSRAPMALKVGDVVNIGGVSAEVTGLPEEREEFGYRGKRVRVPMRVLDGPSAGKEGSQGFGKSDKVQVTGSNRGANAMAGLLKNVSDGLDGIERERAAERAPSTTRGRISQDVKRAVMARDGRAVKGVDMTDPNRWNGDKAHQFRQSATYESNGFGGSNLLDDDRKKAFREAIDEMGRIPSWESRQLDAAARKIQVFRDENQALKDDLTASQRRLGEGVKAALGRMDAEEAARTEVKSIKKANGIPGDAAIKKLPAGQRALAESIIFDAKNVGRVRAAANNNTIAAGLIDAELNRDDLMPRTRAETEKLRRSIDAAASAEGVAEMGAELQAKVDVWNAVRKAVAEGGDPGRSDDYSFYVESGAGLTNDQENELTILGRRDGAALAERAAAILRGDSKPKPALERVSDRIGEQRGTSGSDKAPDIMATAKTAPVGTVLATGTVGGNKFRLVVAERDGRRYVSRQGLDPAAKDWDIGAPSYNADDLRALMRSDEAGGMTWTPDVTPSGRTPRPAPGAAPLIEARAAEQAAIADVTRAVRSDPAAAPVPGAEGYAGMKRHTLIALAREAKVDGAGRKSNTELANALAQRDAEVKASRAAKLNPSSVGTPSTQHETHTPATGPATAPASAAQPTFKVRQDPWGSGLIRHQLIRRDPDGTETIISSGTDEGKLIKRRRELEAEQGPAAPAAKLEKEEAKLRARLDAYRAKRADSPRKRATQAELDVIERLQNLAPQLARSRREERLAAERANPRGLGGMTGLDQAVVDQLVKNNLSKDDTDRLDTEAPSAVANGSVPLAVVLAAADVAPGLRETADRSEFKRLIGLPELPRDMQQRNVREMDISEVRFGDLVLNADGTFPAQVTTITGSGAGRKLFGLGVMNVQPINKSGTVRVVRPKAEAAPVAAPRGRFSADAKRAANERLDTSRVKAQDGGSNATTTTEATMDRDAILAQMKADAQRDADERRRIEAEETARRNTPQPTTAPIPPLVSDADLEARQEAYNSERAARIERLKNASDREAGQILAALNKPQLDDTAKRLGMSESKGLDAATLRRRIRAHLTTRREQQPAAPAARQALYTRVRAKAIEPGMTLIAPRNAGTLAPTKGNEHYGTPFVVASVKTNSIGEIEVRNADGKVMWQAQPHAAISQRMGEIPAPENTDAPAPSAARRMTVGEAGLQQGDKVWVYPTMLNGIGFTGTKPGAPVLATVDGVKAENYGRAKGKTVIYLVDADGNHVGSGALNAKHWLAPVGGPGKA
jgi:hypothetical protein